MQTMASLTLVDLGPWLATATRKLELRLCSGKVHVQFSSVQKVRRPARSVHERPLFMNCSVQFMFISHVSEHGTLVEAVPVRKIPWSPG